MKFEQNKLALAGAEAVGVLYLACVILVWIAPTLAVKFFSFLFHGINLAAITSSSGLNFGAVVIGLIEAFAYTYVGLYLFAWFYNRSVK
ncbi:MAG: DUF5676 family membrane protein [Candidatus Komeilibacteria bacterium]|nr:DUF5676 family membrane protein [Candidatus Komeilibacteria bacterium]